MSAVAKLADNQPGVVFAHDVRSGSQNRRVGPQSRKHVALGLGREVGDVSARADASWSVSLPRDGQGVCVGHCVILQ